MGALVLVEQEAVDRLAELGLGVKVIEQAVRRADAEANMCTPLDPPIMEGLTRWGRTTRFLREELVTAGWDFDNPRNLSRTIHPSGEFAIVATSGDAATGRPGLTPTTKYPKGYATVLAVVANEQLALDLGDYDLGADGPGRRTDTLRTWFLLTYIDEDGFWIELSLPDAIADGQITSWVERICLPVLPLHDDGLSDQALPGGDEDGGIIVEVNRR